MAFDQSQATTATARPTTTICQTSPVRRSRVSGMRSRVRRAGSGVNVVTAQDPSRYSDLRPCAHSARFICCVKNAFSATYVAWPSRTAVRSYRSSPRGDVAIFCRERLTLMGDSHSRVLHRNLRETPPRAVGGDGVWLIAEDGRRILDGSGGAAVSCLGHQHPRVIEAISRQASKLAYAHTGFFSSEPAEQLADRLVGEEPGGLGYAYLVSGGSEAIEASIKLARQYFIECGQPQRQRFIARRQSYHGNTLGALAAGGNAWRREPYAPLLSSAFSHVTPAFAYHEQRDDESEADFVARLAAELEAEFQRLGPDTVAAFIAEPVVGATSGCVPPPEGYFKAVRDICNRHGALLILDEVMCGMGRSGTLRPWEQEGIAPDIQAIAKGLGGGYQPIGAMLASARIIDTIREGFGAVQHGHTYLAHPLAGATALEVQRIIAEEKLLERVR